MHLATCALLLAVVGPTCRGASAQTAIDRKAWMAPSPSTRLRVLKPMRKGADYPGAADYMRVLERFPRFAERGWREKAGPAGQSFFGDPDSAEMGMRSMGNFVFVMALLATDPAYDPRVTGVPRARVLELARACLRYMTDAHVTGASTCGDGKKWGHHWQSAWWTAKMAVGAHLMWSALSDEERLAVRRVVTDEASRHLERKAPSGSLADTKSEENAWDTEVMAAAVAYFPDDPRAPRWRAKLIEFALNSLSTAEDRNSSAVVDGRPLREQVYTANIHSDYTIENHGAYHACYMACPLHSLAWGAYAFASVGAESPQAQFHHFRDVWQRLAPTCLERRFAYMGGKDWPRYAYGLSFIMPALVVLGDRYSDDAARAIEARRFRAFDREQRESADGSFFGKRFTNNVMMDRLLEYETDAYANLGLCYLMHRDGKAPPRRPLSDARLAKALADKHVGSPSLTSYVRTERLFASFAWKRLDGPWPTAYFIPAGSDDMAEWGPANLVGRISVQGVSGRNAVIDHHDEATPNGFRSSGTVRYLKADGSPAYTLAVTFDVDAQAGIADVTSRFVADGDILVVSAEGLRLHVANDRFNGGRRVWHADDGARTLRFDLKGPWPARETIRTVDLPGVWVNLDGKLGIVARSGEDRRFALRVSDRRNGPWGSIHYDVLDSPAMVTIPRHCRKGETVLESSFRLVAGPPERARAISEERQ